MGNVRDNLIAAALFSFLSGALLGDPFADAGKKVREYVFQTIWAHGRVNTAPDRRRSSSTEDPQPSFEDQWVDNRRRRKMDGSGDSAGPGD